MNDHTDILIAGGGVAGITAAAALARDATLRLLERETHLASHASGRSAAMFLPAYGNGAVRALNEASAEAHHHLDGGVLSPRGLMVIARAGKEDAFADQAARMGLAAIDLAEAQAKLPILRADLIARAGWQAAAWDLDTDLLIQNAARRAKAAGAELRTGAEITGISRANGRWQVTAGAKMFTADILVNASGAWADGLASLAGVAPLGLQPMRRSMAQLPAPEGHDIANWPFTEEITERWYARPAGGRWVVSPSEEDPVPAMDAWADDMVLAEGLARYEDMVTAPVTRVETSWAGLRTFAPDRSLVIGRASDHPAFFWLAGQGGYGFQTAPAAARLTADLIAGRPAELDAATTAALAPARFAA
ncbi:NAD(P)/FAD-dependent oxidoreductase [Pseudooceanicola aestuarii]|uniref:NAD(P)/FAD-dependent oxidoreductase n=1 Tax=Pseudooceanicola aestuarii TaxID=2697319 RepID=UPI0013D28657|nr:FAD-dependent oxidoreductase [Pseudooceanicola aestuarii]